MSGKEGEWSVWQGFVRGKVWGIPWRMNNDFEEMPQLYEVLKGWKFIYGPAHNLRAQRGKFLSFTDLLLLISWHDTC